MGSRAYSNLTNGQTDRDSFIRRIERSIPRAVKVNFPLTQMSASYWVKTCQKEPFKNKKTQHTYIPINAYNINTICKKQHIT